MKKNLSDPILPYIMHCNEKFRIKMEKMLKNNPDKIGITRQELRIFSPFLKKSTWYIDFVKEFANLVDLKRVLYKVKMEEYYKTIIEGCNKNGMFVLINDNDKYILVVKCLDSVSKKICGLKIDT